MTFSTYCWQENDDDFNKITYGAIYTETVSTSEKNICPSGWHVSTHEDWLELEQDLGRAEIAGGKLKAVGTDYL